MNRFVTWYIYDGFTGRLMVAADDDAITVAFSDDNGFATVADRRGQRLELKHPVVVKETTIQGNGGYTIVDVYWYDDRWLSSRHFTDDEAIDNQIATAGFALQWNPEKGEHTVLTRSGMSESPRHDVVAAATSRFLAL